MTLPDSSQHLLTVGATGSGKTQAALWHLSMSDIDTRAHIVYNFKTDANINNVPHSRQIGLDEIPVKPGVYIVQPHPSQTDEVERQMWEIWERGEIGVYVDEAYMVGKNNEAFRALMTQGRSRNIPMKISSQRPVWLDPFAVSEASFYQVFRLNHKRDVKSVQEFIPSDISKRLPDYHSYYYDVPANKMTVLRPVPGMAEIHRTFERRLARTRKTV